jgi:hypothetical protein
MPSPTSPIRSASRASLVFLSVLLAAGACSSSATPLPTIGPSVPVASPSQSLPPSVPASASVAPSVTPTVAPTLAPTVAPTKAPSPAACATRVDAAIAPSDRLTGVAVEPGIGVDKIVFTFGPSTGIPSGTKPTGELKPTAPPFSLAGSGQAVDVAGQRFIAVTFRGMAIADEQGNPSYTGPDDIKPNALAVRELRLVDDFEGIVTWIAGVDGPGCAAVTRLTGPARIVVAVTQP